MSRPKFTRPCERAAEIAALLMGGPKTTRQIAQALDLAVHRNNTVYLRHYLLAFHDKALIYIKEWVRVPKATHWAAVWAWQPSIGHHADAPMPTALR